MSVTISQLPPATALTGDELLPVVQDNATVRTTALDIATLAGGGGGGFANPTVVIGLSVHNGIAGTAMRSDAAPPLSQSIAPTWSAAHTFTSTVALNGATTVSGTSIRSAGLITSDLMATARLGSGSATENTLLHGDSTWSSVSLSADVAGDLPVTNLNGGSGASASTYWRGDGTWAAASGGGGGNRTLVTLNPTPTTDTQGYNVVAASIDAGTLATGDVLHIFASGTISFSASGNVDVDLDLSFQDASLFPRIRIGANVAVVDTTASGFYFDAYCPANGTGLSSGIMFFDTFSVSTFPSPNEACQKVLDTPAVTPLAFRGKQDGPFATNLTEAFAARLQLRTPEDTIPPAMDATFVGTAYIEIISP